MLIRSSCNRNHIIGEFLGHILNTDHDEFDILVLHPFGKFHDPSAALSLTHQFGCYRNDDFFIGQTVFFTQRLCITAVENVLGIHAVVNNPNIPIFQERAFHSVCQPAGGRCNHHIMQFFPLRLLPAEHLSGKVKEERGRVFPYLRAVAAAGLPVLTVIGIAAFTRIGIFAVERIHQRNLVRCDIVVERLQIHEIRMGFM